MVKKKILPAFDIYASCPSDDLILDYYKNRFNSVFIAYHQCYKPDNIPMSKFEGDDFPTNAEIRSGCTAISWAEIISKVSLNTPSEMDVGLRTHIGGLKRQFENKAFSDAIRQFSKETSISIPDEGCICPFVEGKLLSALHELGYEWLWVGDEFGIERRLKWIEDILIKDELPYSACSYTPNKKILIATHWDSHCTFICANNKLLTSLINKAEIEGFYCDERTKVYWGVGN